MAENDESGDKTEAPTEQRREKSKKEGQVAKSPEVASAVAMLLFVGVVYWYIGFLAPKLESVVQGSLDLSSYSLREFGIDQAVRAVRQIALETFQAVGPVLAVAMVLGIVSNVMQVGLNLEWSLLGFKWNRLDVIAWGKRMLSAELPVGLIRSLLKAAGVVGVAVYAAKDRVQPMAFLPYGNLAQMGRLIREVVFAVSVRVALLLGVVAALDYAWTRYRHEQKLKMSKKEIKDEMKQTEGNPEQKAALRRRARERAGARLRDDLKTATVVSTNPTHYSVALRYQKDKDPSPRVIAKGQDFRALRIRELARELGIPVVEDKPLTRAMYASVKVGDVVPVELYRGVARLLAIVYKKQPKTGRRA